MRIHKLYIKQFGKLKELELSFTKEIQLIEGENEAGKSTLQRFFLWMFYGAVPIKEFNLNLRELAVPQGETYAFGSLEVFFDSSQLIIERRSGLNRRDDFLRIYEKNSKEQRYYQEPLGKSIFGLTVHEFIKTLFMGSETTSAFNDKNDGLFMKLSNLLDSGEEEVSYKKAAEDIDRQIKVLKNGKNAGSIPQLQGEIRSLFAELEASKRMFLEKEKIQNELEVLDTELISLKRQQDLLSELQTKARLFHKKSDILKLKGALDELNELIAEKEKNWISLSEVDAKMIREKIEQLHLAQEDLLKMNEEHQRTVRDLELYLTYEEDLKLMDEIKAETWMQLIEEEQEEHRLQRELLKNREHQGYDHSFGSRKEEVLLLLKKYERQLKWLKSTQRSGRFPLILMLFIAAAVFSLLRPSGLIFSTHFLLVPSLIIYAPPVQRKLRSHALTKIRHSENQIDQISLELGLDPGEVLRSKKILLMTEDTEHLRILSQKIEDIQKNREYYYRISGTSTLKALASVMETCRKNIGLHQERQAKETILRERIRPQQDKITLLERDLIYHLSPLGYDPDKASLDDFWEGYELNKVRRSLLEEKENQLHLSIKGLIGEEPLERVLEELSAFEELSLQEDISEELLSEKNQHLSLQLEKMTTAKTELSEKYERLQFRDPYYLEDYLNTKHIEEQSLHRRLSVLLKTKELLMNAEDLLKKQYVQILGDEVSRRFEQITGMKRTVFVEDLNSMSFQEGIHRKDDKKLSSGALSQLYLSLRLTMINRIFSENSVPILMDEVFNSFDDLRMENALKLLITEFSSYQIFIFTSHKRERVFLENSAEILVLPKKDNM
ncbi:ATP-binding protein [Proteiniclasticum ruminis]|uniref:AAA domain-containing protein n=1 Tax=Proteiniclasticum ruminis TaxID=398199 RepID=A0A1I4XWH8_9CLOT|nr:AAA family ATPase [Proteiniclasticum ruminis]SFN29733.1 AAA domain-containing protein [Proteiniclasticum ruminis]